jgi:hypothetical protein
MQRRTVLSSLPFALLPVAGCASPGPGGVRDTRFRRTGDCAVENEGASVTVDGADVVVEGCVVGANGCAEARLAGTTLDDSELTVVVETFVPPDAEGCTQALVGRTYRATVGLADAPESVGVVHRGVGDDRTVARWP